MKTIKAVLLLALLVFGAAAPPAEATVTATAIRVTALPNFFVVTFSVSITGSYSTGGETIALPASVIKSLAPPDFIQITGQAGFKYEYFYSGSTNQTGKLIVRGQQPTSATSGVIALDQIAATTYPAGVTGDVIRGVAYIPRMVLEPTQTFTPTRTFTLTPTRTPTP